MANKNNSYEDIFKKMEQVGFKINQVESIMDLAKEVSSQENIRFSHILLEHFVHKNEFKEVVMKNDIREMENRMIINYMKEQQSQTRWIIGMVIAVVVCAIGVFKYLS